MNSEIDLRSLLGIIRRQIWLILSILVGLMALATLITFSLEQRYTATALVFVDTAGKDLLEADVRAQNGSTDNARVESEVAIIQSDGVLLDVIRNQNLVADDEFGVKIGTIDRLLQMLRLKPASEQDPAEAFGQVLKKFKSSVDVNRRGLTYLIAVSVTSRDREKAATLANALTERYIRRQVASKTSSTINSRETLRQQVEVARAAISESEKRVDDFILENINRLKEEGSPNIVALHNELTRLQDERRQGVSRLETLDQSLEQNDMSALVRSLQTAAAEELERQRQEIAARLSSATPQAAVDLRAELQRLDQSIAEAGQQELSSLRSTISSLDQRESTTRTNLTQAVLNSELPEGTLSQIYSLRQNAQLARQSFDQLSARLQMLDTQAALQMPDSRVVSEALPPQDPSFPRKRLILPLAAVMALGIGVALAFVREYFVGGFTNEDQVESVLRLPLATITPREADDLARKEGSVLSLSDIVVRSPLSMFAESVRRIRVAIDQNLFQRQGATEDGAGGTVIMVSSALPNEGKSTMALSLARTYALSGKRTLIIDCDLRKPSLNRHLGLDPSTAFVDYLRAAVDTSGSLPKLTALDSSTGLMVILGGRRSNIPTDQLFMSGEMAKLIATARRNFDYIILDTPPVEPVVDGLYLARYVDVIAFVIKWAATPQSSAKRAVASLRKSAPEGIPLVAVLNQQERAKLLGYGSYSQYYVE